jgi:NADH-quinone oxidoreductase subunit N
MNDISSDLLITLPEIALAGAGLALLMLGAFLGDKATKLVIGLAVAALAGTLALVLDEMPGRAIAFNGLFIADHFATMMKGLTLLSGILALLLSYATLKEEELDRPEYPVLIVFSTLGMMLMISANDLLTLFIGFELQSLALYVLAAFRRDSARSSEAGLKYFLLGALSTGLLLYGISLIYGFSGTTSFSQLANVLQSGMNPALGLTVGMVFLAAGLAFKVSAVPFHMWTPDVYEGAPTPVTAFFSLAPKVAAVALFARVVFGPFGHIIEQWHQILWTISVASMIVGSLGAIAQSNIKRLMAYSSITNIGYALIGLTAGTQAGIQGLIIYMAIYIVTTAGAFGVILTMKRNGLMVEEIGSLAGLSRTRPGLAAAMMVFMFSLAGIPPLAGFFAKFYVFIAAVDAQMYWLAVIGVLASVIGAYYYLRIIKIMYFDEAAGGFDAPHRAASTIAYASALAMLLFFIMPSTLVNQAEKAALSLVVE